MRNERQAQRRAILQSLITQRANSKKSYSTMHKATVIATCLFNSKMVADIYSGEAAVLEIFEERFPSKNFDKWNTLVIDTAATLIINNVGCAAQIQVDRFITDLWDLVDYKTMDDELTEQVTE